MQNFSWSVLGIFASGLIISACTKKEPSAPPGAPSAGASAAQLVERGRKSYQINCIACHNTDPKKDGVLGPAIWGSSLELLRLRLLEAKYPAGYKSKRDSKSMAALPHLRDEIEALHAYLNAN